MRFLWLVSLAAFLLPGQGKAAELSAGDVKSAHKLYVAKCAKCHEFYPPSNYNQKDWDLWMGKMSRKSRLKSQQQTLLVRYLDQVRAGTIPNPHKATSSSSR